jgi:hypothetical protein
MKNIIVFLGEASRACHVDTPLEDAKQHWLSDTILAIIATVTSAGGASLRPYTDRHAYSECPFYRKGYPF